MKIFIDANVLFTAAYSPQGKAALVIENLGKLIVTSDYALAEARRNIQAKKPTALAVLDGFVAKIKIITLIKPIECPIKLPPKDVPIFQAALQAKATHLLTGDIKDFGPHMNQPKKSAGIVIQTVADFLNSIF